MDFLLDLGVGWVRGGVAFFPLREKVMRPWILLKKSKEIEREDVSFPFRLISMAGVIGWRK